MMASTSISTRCAGSIRRDTSTIVDAGRISLKISPCARPTSCQCEMSLRKIRVRTTSLNDPPAASRALPTIAKMALVCPYGSPGDKTLPSFAVAVVPATEMWLPTRTAREYPTFGSHGDPDPTCTLAPVMTILHPVRNLKRSGAVTVSCYPSRVQATRHPFDLRLLVLDADGTLFTSDEKVSERTRSAIRHAQDRGVTVAIASGRRRARTVEVFDRLRLDGVYLISSQGTAVWEDPMGTNPVLLAHNPLPRAEAIRVLSRIRAHKLASVMIGHPGVQDTIFHDGDLDAYPAIGRYVQFNGVAAKPLDDSPDGPAFGLDPTQFVVLAPLARLRDLRDDLTGRPVVRDRYEPYPELGVHPLDATAERPWHVIFSRGQFTAGAALEVVGPTTNKATAVAALAGHLSIGNESVAAFGDNINDVEMLGAVGLGVAMGNATPAARAAAWSGIARRDGAHSVATMDRIAPSNDKDGIAWTLDYLLEGHLPPGWSPALG